MNIKLLLLMSFIYTVVFLCVVFGYIPSYIIPLPFFDKNHKEKMEITFFDVGQGDSIYIKTHSGERLLIDGGESSDVDYKISQKFIFPQCFFDYIILTHPHLDHYGGLLRVTQHCGFKYFTFNDVQCKSNACKYFSGISNKKSILIGDNISFNDVTIKVLWPDLKNTNIDYSNPNNLSVVLFIDYGEFEALLTGDAQKEVLESINVSEIAPFIQNGLDIYKVSHHGAVNGMSESLLQSLKPINCVISVGKDNPYNHPHKPVLTQLKKIGCNILRTDELGDISFLW